MIGRQHERDEWTLAAADVQDFVYDESPGDGSVDLAAWRRAGGRGAGGHRQAFYRCRQCRAAKYTPTASPEAHWRLTQVTVQARECGARRGQSSLQASRNRWPRVRVELAVIEAEVLKHRRCDVALGEVRDVARLAERGRVRADDRDPDVLASLDAGVMFRPVCGRAATTVIGRDDERRAAAVLLHRLQRLPQLRDHAVREVQVVEHEVVAARVRPVVRLAEANPHQARLVLLEVAERDPEAQVVVAAFFPQLHDVLPKPDEQVDFRRRERGRYRLARAVHEERAVLLRGRVLESVPGADLRDFRRLEPELGMHVVEHGLVRVADEVVALDFRLRLAGQDLGVAGVGKPLVVADRDLAALRLVAEHHSGGHERLPEERHQRLAPRFRRLAPVARFRDVDLVDAGLGFRRVRDHRVHAAEEFLDAHAVDRDEDDVSIRGRLGRGKREAAREHDCAGGEAPCGAGRDQFTPLITRS